jgi:hypothetical protein
MEESKMIAEPSTAKRCAVYARLSETDDAVTAPEERDTMYAKGAERLGCGVVRVYENLDAKGCWDEFRKLVADCQNGSFDAVLLFDLTVGFAKWQPYERKLAECGVQCLKARADNGFASEKESRWRELLRQKHEKDWQDWVDHSTQPMLYEPDNE